MNASIVGMIIGAIVIAGAAFYAGMMYAEAPQMQSNTEEPSTSNVTLHGPDSGQEMTTPIVGEVVSSNGNTITLKLLSGSIKTIVVGASTYVVKSEVGALTDIKPGTTIAITSSSGSDGSVTVQSVSISPPRPAQTQ